LDVEETRGRETADMAKALGGKSPLRPKPILPETKTLKIPFRGQAYGAINFLANIAGNSAYQLHRRFPLEKYDLMQRIMLRAPFYLSPNSAFLK